MYLCKKRCNVLCPIPQRFSTPAASRLCLQKLLDFHPEISFFSFCFWFSNIAVGRLSAANEQSELWRLNIHIILLSSALNKISTQCYKIEIIKEFLAICVFYLAVPKFYLELAESRQNLWLSEWELSLSQKRNVWHSGTLRRILHVKM